MTDKEKQIAEMAKLACSVFDGNCTGCSFAFYPPCPPKASAERLYNAGYRKHVKGEWLERVEYNELEDCEDEFYQCSVCGLCTPCAPNFCMDCGAKMSGGNGND